MHLKFSEATVQNTQSLTISNDSNLIQVPTHNITQDETNNQNQDNTLSTTQDNTSVLSTSHSNITQPSQTQASPRQNYDPPPIPPQFNSHLRFTLIILLNKALQIHNIMHNPIIQINFKHQLHHHHLKYKLQLILQLRVIQYKRYKVV